eukprot:15444214-Alexandrium_andersonii.AAC.1
MAVNISPAHQGLRLAVARSGDPQRRRWAKARSPTTDHQQCQRCAAGRSVIEYAYFNYAR